MANTMSLLTMDMDCGRDTSIDDEGVMGKQLVAIQSKRSRSFQDIHS